MTEAETLIEAHPLQALTLCLDFANTVEGTRDRPRESLFDYADLVAWSRPAGALDEAQAGRLLSSAAARPAEAAAVLARALVLREAIYRLFSAVAADHALAAADLALLNAEVAQGAPQRQLVATEHGCRWVWRAVDALDRPLWPLAASAADLLTASDLDRVRECASDTCAWLFIDHSRNHSRRWCDMADCGNRAKARRHYERQRAARRE